MFVVVIFELILLCVVVFLILRELISFKRTSWYAIASTWVGWLLCFAIVFLLPLDILNSDHQNCLNEHKNNEADCPEPWSFLPPGFMIAQWKTLYWGSFILSWLVFPLLQTYWLAGDFHPWERFLRSIKENLILYSVMGVIAVVAVIGLKIAGKLDESQLVGVIMSLANVYGLFLVVLTMGYGMVDIPRYLFRMGSRDDMMEHYYIQTVIYKDGLEQAQNHLTKTLKQVKLISEKVRDSDPYRPYVDKIISKCPLEYDHIERGEGDQEITYAKLASLHAKVKDAGHSAQRAAILYEMTLKHAHEEEDVIASHNAPDKIIHWTFKAPRAAKHAVLLNKLEYVWLVYLYPWTFRLLAVIAAILSITIVWCELTLLATKNVSPFSHIINSSNMGGFGKQLFCFIPLFYMTVCSYTTLFKLRIFNYFRLVRHHMSDAHSIMFSANYLCRLAAPLAYNFLSIIRQSDASFDAVMGDMDAAGNPLFGPTFRKVFPILVVIICLMALFRVFSRIGACCCIKSLQYTVDDSPVAAERGRAILKESRDHKCQGGQFNNKTIKQAVIARFSGMKNALTSIRTTQEGIDEDLAPKDGATISGLNAINNNNNSSSSASSGSVNGYGSRVNRPTFVTTSNATSVTAPLRSPPTASGYSSTKSGYVTAPQNSSIINNSSSESSGSRSSKGGLFSNIFGGRKGDDVELLPRNGPRSDM